MVRALLLFLPVCTGLETGLYQRTSNMTNSTFSRNITKTIMAQSVQECTLKCTFFNNRGTVCNAVRYGISKTNVKKKLRLICKYLKDKSKSLTRLGKDADGVIGQI
jgi:hypothetical protein